MTERLRRENRTEVARIEDVPLGEYRGIYGANASMKLVRQGDHLVLEREDSRTEGVELVLQPDGTFAVPGHYGAWLSTRDGTTTLTVSYCYMFAIYELQSGLLSERDMRARAVLAGCVRQLRRRIVGPPACSTYVRVHAARGAAPRSAGVPQPRRLGRGMVHRSSLAIGK
jgi:hypothetical protein